MMFYGTNRRLALHWTLSFLICLPFLNGMSSLAQSGRKQDQQQNASDKTSKRDGENQARKDVYGEEAPPLSLIVVTSPSSYAQSGDFIPSYFPWGELEHKARGGCVVELRNEYGIHPLEDEDVTRWEAREMARIEDKALVLWMDLKPASITSQTQFRLRYLLFEPKTGKIISSGEGTPSRQTWGLPAPQQRSLPDYIYESGRNIAQQIMRDLKIQRK